MGRPVDAGEVRRMLFRVGGVEAVEPVRGEPDAVRVVCEPPALRPAKARLMREGLSYQARRGGGDEHVFKSSGGTGRRGPPRNSKELTEAARSGDFVFGGGRR